MLDLEELWNPSEYSIRCAIETATHWGKQKMAKSIYGVFGNPVKHSRSPEIHQMFASQAGIEIEYKKIEAPVKGFTAEVREFLAAGGKGFNVTLPFKEEAFALVDACSPVAARAEAVNTVIVQGEDHLFGENTDGSGLIKDISSNLGWSIEGQSLLIIGAGGAVRGILGNILDERPLKVVITNRTLSRATQLASRFNADLCEVKGFDELDDHYDLIINGTSASLSREIPGISSSIFSRQSKCYDLMYAANETAFNSWAKTEGAREVSDGLGMLVEQAAKAFELWTGYKPQTTEVITRLRKQL